MAASRSTLAVGVRGVGVDAVVHRFHAHAREGPAVRRYFTASEFAMAECR